MVDRVKALGALDCPGGSGNSLLAVFYADGVVIAEVGLLSACIAGYRTYGMSNATGSV